MCNDAAGVDNRLVTFVFENLLEECSSAATRADEVAYLAFAARNDKGEAKRLTINSGVPERLPRVSGICAA